MYYYRGLAEWNREKGYLTDTCRDGQDTFKRLMKRNRQIKHRIEFRPVNVRKYKQKRSVRL